MLCNASYEWPGPEHVRCVLQFGPNEHDLAADPDDVLGLGTPIHRDHLGREWTRRGPYRRNATRARPAPEVEP